MMILDEMTYRKTSKIEHISFNIWVPWLGFAVVVNNSLILRPIFRLITYTISWRLPITNGADGFDSEVFNPKPSPWSSKFTTTTTYITYDKQTTKYSTHFYAIFWHMTIIFTGNLLLQFKKHRHFNNAYFRYNFSVKS